MNYANFNKGLKYNIIIKFIQIIYKLFCTKVKHLQYENGQFHFYQG
jgi:hypothetical protein